MLERRKVRVTYRTASRGLKPSERIIAACCLLPYEHSWQVIAHDSLRGAVRMFKVDRIERAELTEERYESPEDFDVTAYLGPTWGVLRGEAGPAETVVLRFTPRAAPWVRDERWHPSQDMETLPDGALMLRFRCGITHELVRWVLSYGAEVTVERPQQLREMVVTEAAQILERGSEAT